MGFIDKVWIYIQIVINILIWSFFDYPEENMKSIWTLERH